MSDDIEQAAADRLEQFRQGIEGSDNALAVIAKLNDGIHQASGLDLRTFHLVRAAAMAASAAPAASWEAQLLMMADSIGDADLMGTLIAIAPIIGTARYATAIDQISD